MRALAALLAALSAAAPAAAAPVLRASVEPARVSVGDPFTYVVEAEGVGAATIEADAGAFDAVAEPRVERDGDSVRVVQRLACLGAACVPETGPRAVALPAPRAGAATGAPAIVTVVPRLSAAAVRAERPAFRATTTAPDPPRAGPAVPALWAAAALLALAGATLLAAEVRARRRSRRCAAEAGDLRDRAVRLLRESALRPPPDRRRAADLARRVVGSGELAAAASRLAWSRPEPAPEDVEWLAARVESEP
jgi:hypothetical protein